MTTGMRKRGRPLGSCKDDSPLLRQVADILQSDKKLKPTTAIKRVLASPDPSPIRRLQSKWKQEGSKYLQQAQTQAAYRAAEQRDRAIAGFRERERNFGYGIAGLAASKAIQDILGMSVGGATYEMMKTQRLLTNNLPINGSITGALEKAARDLLKTPEGSKAYEQSLKIERSLEMRHDSFLLKAFKQTERERQRILEQLSDPFGFSSLRGLRGTI